MSAEDVMPEGVGVWLVGGLVCVAFAGLLVGYSIRPARCVESASAGQTVECSVGGRISRAMPLAKDAVFATCTCAPRSP